MKRPSRVPCCAFDGTASSQQIRTTGLAAYAPVNRREFRQWNTEDVKRCNKSVSQGQACSSDTFITTRTHQDPFAAVCDATLALKLAKEFHVFHQWHFRKTANVQEGRAPAEYAMVATPHSQQNPGVMRKGVRQSINTGSRQANSKVTASDLRIIQGALDLIQASRRNFGINMDEPKDVAAGGVCTSIHLCCSIALA